MEQLIPEKKSTPKRLYYWGLLGLFPNVGFVCGLILFFRGIFQYKDKKVVLIGIGDILFTIFFWMAFNYYLTHSSEWVKLDSKVTQEQLNSLFKGIEFYKLEHGNYPDSLEQISKEDKTIWINDFLQLSRNKKTVHYNYSKAGKKYTLFSSGMDGIPNTKDDIYPVMEKADSSKFGLIINERK